MNDKGVCRTAPDTPGLLIILGFVCTYEEEYSVKLKFLIVNCLSMVVFLRPYFGEQIAN